MAIDIPGLDFLMRHKHLIKGNSLQIGRQGIHLIEPFAKFADAHVVWNKYEDKISFERMFDDYNGHTEVLFKYLGADVVDSIDISDYEQCTIVHDLNNPVPEELHNKYDFIYDGGTIEHIYDIKTCMDNIKKMLKVNGVFISINGTNNFCGHGFYQFSPELYRTVFSEDAGYRMITLQLMDVRPDPVGIDIPDNHMMRQDIKTGTMQVYIAAAMEKVVDMNIDGNFQQSDYVPIWEDGWNWQHKLLQEQNENKDNKEQ